MRACIIHNVTVSMKLNHYLNVISAQNMLQISVDFEPNNQKLV